MLESETQGVIHLFKVSFPYLAVTLAYATAILVVEEFLGDRVYSMPGQLGAVFGLAVAFFLGFRMNSAYDRWWEARKIFGELTNNSRSFVAKIHAYLNSSSSAPQQGVTDSTREVEELIQLFVLYIRYLKSEIHDQVPLRLDETTSNLQVTCGVDSKAMSTNAILRVIAARLERLTAGSRSLVQYDLMQFVNVFFDIQGKIERIKNTPFLKEYGAFTRLIVLFYVLLIPFFVGDIDLGGENSNLEYLAIPILAVISTAFLTINRLANLYGEPLRKNMTSIPIESICDSIVDECLAIKVKLETEHVTETIGGDHYVDSRDRRTVAMNDSEVTS